MRPSSLLILEDCFVGVVAIVMETEPTAFCCFPRRSNRKRSRRESWQKSKHERTRHHAIPATNVVLLVRVAQRNPLCILMIHNLQTISIRWAFPHDDVVDYLQRTEEITPHPPGIIGAYNSSNNFVHHPRRLRHYCQYPCTTTNSRKYNNRGW